MYIYWRSLIFFGFVFWLFLNTTDLFAKTKYEVDFEEYSQNTEITKPLKTLEKSKESVKETKSAHFGLSLLLANCVIFVVSLVFCSLAKFLTTAIWKMYTMVNKSPADHSKIPSDIKSTQVTDEKSHVNTRASDTSVHIINKTNSDLSSEISCPNLRLQKIADDKNCQTIFHSYSFSRNEGALRAECIKLREELLNLHTNSLREHALLSRKLEGLTREKRDLVKRSTSLQRENQAAKLQIGELVGEKSLLQDRLENSTKEFKLNMKTKKTALAKLEEISTTVDNLKKQLEQVTRDKEILEEKFEVVRCEYEQLQDRLRYYQNKNLHRDVAERDDVQETLALEQGDFNKSTISLKMEDESFSSINQVVSKESVYLPYVISQTESDMKNIQIKILQLEENLKNFTPHKNVINPEENQNDLVAEPDHQTAAKKLANTISKLTNSKMDASENLSGFGEITCRKRYEDIKIQILTNALKEKLRQLERINDENVDIFTSPEVIETTDIDLEESEDETTDSRIVSNSEAFQTFLKNIKS